MSDAPRAEIDLAAFWRDPYPALAAMRRDAPIAYVPQLGATLITRRDDIYVCEKNVAVFSSHQPAGLMNVLMGHNMMRKDGDEHMAERHAIFPTVSPKTVRDSWTAAFTNHADAVLDDLAPLGGADLRTAFALRYSAECLKSVTGLTNMRFEDMDAWSQAMIDGIANYAGDPDIEARCHEATQGIDAAIDAMVPELRGTPNHSLLSVMLQSGMPMDSVRANVKLAISGGQNEPRDAIAGLAWALLAHPDQLAKVMSGEVGWMQAFDEYCRWVAPIGMSPRRVARSHDYGGVHFDPEDRVFLMFGSANRDEAHFTEPDRFDVTRDTAKSIAFGAGPHFCAGAWVARAMVATVAMPELFGRLKGLRLADPAAVSVGGWAFRGVLSLPVEWDR
ncbi:MAG: cytochrome P450 [Brucellaceae bacterium]|nr:cytochrome P450 [Brucellaceae bacterium]